MTKHHNLKEAIRQRVAVTGEKYTQARRAILAEGERRHSQSRQATIEPDINRVERTA